MNARDTISRAVTVADVKNLIGFGTLLIAVVASWVQMQGGLESTRAGVIAANMKLDQVTDKISLIDNRTIKLETIIDQAQRRGEISHKNNGLNLQGLTFASSSGIFN